MGYLYSGPTPSRRREYNARGGGRPPRSRHRADTSRPTGGDASKTPSTQHQVRHHESECVDVNLLALVRARERVGEEGCEVRACKRGVRFCERWHSICANRWREDSRGIFETRKITTVINEWRRQLKRACYPSRGQKSKLPAQTKVAASFLFAQGLARSITPLESHTPDREGAGGRSLHRRPSSKLLLTA